MGVIVKNSNDLSFFDFQVFWDISGVTPVINVNNLTETLGSPPNLTFWFVVTSPSGTTIHQGSFAQPDETGGWSSLIIADPFPMPFNSIEWSGAPYSITGYVQDGAGNIYQQTYTQVICRPQGNTNLSKNTYGAGSVNVNVQCNKARVFLEDQTNTSYQGIAGSRVSSVIRVIYPMDQTDTLPTPFSADNFSAALIPITYSSPNYQFVYNSVYDYAFGNSVVRIKYRQSQTFSVLCDIDLSPIVCELFKISNSIETGDCKDVEEAREKMAAITPKLFLAFVGIQQPLTGIDVSSLIDSIQKIGGFDCSCCYAPSGIIPDTASVIDGYTFSVEGTCGDITGSVVQNGNNIQFLLQDRTYSFVIGNGTSTAFKVISPTPIGCAPKIFALNVNLNILATDILNTIKGDAGLVNLFNSIVSGAQAMINVDGKCVFASNRVYDYTFGLSNIPANTTYAILTSISVGAGFAPLLVRQLSYSFNLTSLAGLQTYLNGLNLGTFTVAAGSGGAITITSTANPNGLLNLAYSVAPNNYIATQVSSSSGFVPVSDEYAVQQIVNYMCGITTAQVFTDSAYSVPSITVTGGVPAKTQNSVASGATVAALIAQEIINQNAVIDYILSLNGGANCTALKTLFQPNINPLISGDLIYGLKSNGCAGITPLELFKRLLEVAMADTTASQLFCQFVASCGAGLSCTAYDYFQVIVSPNNGFSNIVGIEGTFFASP